VGLGLGVEATVLSTHEPRALMGSCHVEKCAGWECWLGVFCIQALGHGWLVSSPIYSWAATDPGGHGMVMTTVTLTGLGLPHRLYHHHRAL
jgi:hypothetical protein